MNTRLDAIDLRMLHHLQDEGRITQSRLATIVGRSVPAVGARMQRLEAAGVIVGFHAEVNPSRLHHPVAAFAWVTLRERRDQGAFASFVRERVDVLEAHATTNGTTQVLKLRTRSQAALDQALAEIEAWPGVQRLDASIVTRTHKETRRLPVHLNGSPDAAESPRPTAYRPNGPES